MKRIRADWARLGQAAKPHPRRGKVHGKISYQCANGKHGEKCFKMSCPCFCHSEVQETQT